MWDRPRASTAASATGRGTSRSALLRSGRGVLIPVQVLDRRPTTERLDAARRYPDQDEVDQVRVAFQAPVVPGLGTALCSLGDATALAVPHGARLRGHTLANAWIEVRLEPSGALTVRDRRSGERYGGLGALEWVRDSGDTYTYSPAGSVRRVDGRPVRVRRVASGPLVAALEMRYAFDAGASPVGGGPGRVGVRVTLALHADSPIVRVIFVIENEAANYRLRARFPTGVAGVATAGAPFGAVARPNRDGGLYPLETPVHTAPAHRFVAVSAGRRGLAVLAPGFFVYECAEGGDLMVTLLRAVGELSRADTPDAPGACGLAHRDSARTVSRGRAESELGLVPVDAAELDRAHTLPAALGRVFPAASWVLASGRGRARRDVDRHHARRRGTGVFSGEARGGRGALGVALLQRERSVRGRDVAVRPSGRRRASRQNGRARLDRPRPRRSGPVGPLRRRGCTSW